MKFGLNLFSLRKQIATKEAFYATACRLADMGYDYLQFSGEPFDPETIEEVSRRAGLPVLLTHVPLDRILHDTKALVAEHAVFGCARVGLGSMPFKNLPEQEMLDNIVTLRTATERLREEGAAFFYHNHQHEFIKLSSGKTVFDALIEEIPALNFTLDTHWLQLGGVSILEYIERCKGRIECVHLKDYLPTFPDGKFKPKFAPVGDGNINWHDVIPKFLASGTRYFFVEQDDATDAEDPFAEVGRSIRYLKEHF